MGRLVDLAELLEGDDLGAALVALSVMRDAVEERAETLVGTARKRGWGWADLARVLGLSRASVHARYTPLVGR